MTEQDMFEPNDVNIILITRSRAGDILVVLVIKLECLVLLVLV